MRCPSSCPATSVNTTETTLLSTILHGAGGLTGDLAPATCDAVTKTLGVARVKGAAWARFI